MNVIRGFICSAPVYEYDGWLFEFSEYHHMPWPLKKDGDARKRAGRKFYEMFEKFLSLPEDQQHECRIGGGCQPL